MIKPSLRHLKIENLLIWPTILGPNLLCILAIVYLSATVTYATTNKAGTKIKSTSIIEIRVGLLEYILN